MQAYIVSDLGFGNGRFVSVFNLYRWTKRVRLDKTQKLLVPTFLPPGRGIQAYIRSQAFGGAVYKGFLRFEKRTGIRPVRLEACAPAADVCALVTQEGFRRLLQVSVAFRSFPYLSVSFRARCAAF